MFEKILVALDGSDATDAVIGVAIGLAKKAGSAVEVVHVHEHDLITSKAGVSGVPLELETPAEGKQIVDGALEKLKASGVTAHGTLVQAHTRDVPKRIIDAAGEVGADMIIVGRRGLSNLELMV